MLAGRVADGLHELSQDSLHGGMRRGIEEAARQVGIRVSDLERLLPMKDVQEAAERLNVAQQDAVEAWMVHAGQLGGLLQGVADLTNDGRMPDVSMFLERLAAKLVRDQAVAVPLQALAMELAAWLDHVERCSELLAEGGALESVYRRRRIRRTGIAVASGLVLATGLGFGTSLRAARARVDAALASVDPCAVTTIDEHDRDRASSAQRLAVTQHRDACIGRRRREEQARDDLRRREEQAREETRSREDRERRCEIIASRLGSLEASPADEAIVGGTGPLLARVVKGALTRDDMVTETLPCTGTKGGTVIDAAFERAVLSSPASWCSAEALSDRVRSILARHTAELPGVNKQTLGGNAEDWAKKALVRGGAELTARAMRLCQVKEEIGIAPGKHCFAILGTSRKR